MTQSNQMNASIPVKCPSIVNEGWISWLSVVDTMDSKNRIAQLAFNIMLIFSTVFLNSLSVITIRKSSQLRNKICYFVILLQSTADCVVGVISIPLYVVFLAAPLLGIKNCLVIMVLIEAVFMVPSLSTGALSAMTV